MGGRAGGEEVVNEDEVGPFAELGAKFSGLVLAPEHEGVLEISEAGAAAKTGLRNCFSNAFESVAVGNPPFLCEEVGDFLSLVKVTPLFAAEVEWDGDEN